MIRIPKSPQNIDLSAIKKRQEHNRVSGPDGRRKHRVNARSCFSVFTFFVSFFCSVEFPQWFHLFQCYLGIMTGDTMSLPGLVAWRMMRFLDAVMRLSFSRGNNTSWQIPRQSESEVYRESICGTSYFPLQTLNCAIRIHFRIKGSSFLLFLCKTMFCLPEQEHSTLSTCFFPISSNLTVDFCFYYIADWKPVD